MWLFSVFQTLADQIRTIIKEDGFLTLKYLKYTRIHRRKTLQFQTHQVAPTKNNIAEMNCQHLKMNTASNPTEILSQEQLTNPENLKRIMNSVKTTLPSLRNIEWRTFKTETNRINQMLHYISINNISELNDLIDAGEKLVYEKIGVQSKSMKKQFKQGWEVWLETQMKKVDENKPKW